MREANSIWGCVEMDAASRDFDYAEYLNYHYKTGCKGGVLSEEGYYLVTDILFASIDAEASLGEQDKTKS